MRSDVVQFGLEKNPTIPCELLTDESLFISAGGSSTSRFPAEAIPLRTARSRSVVRIQPGDCLEQRSATCFQPSTGRNGQSGFSGREAHLRHCLNREFWELLIIVGRSGGTPLFYPVER